MPASKSSNSSRTSRGPRRGSSGAPSLLRPALVLLTLALAAVLWFWRQDCLAWYGDAAAHLNIGRRITDGRTPGYEQFGTVWLPLPHLILAITSWPDALWRSGLAGAAASLPFFVGAGLLVYAIAGRLYLSGAAAWTALLVFALNPNMLFLQAMAMTEALFAFGVLLALYGTLRISPWLTGAGLFAASMTRYEGWFLIPFAVLYLFWQDRRAGLIAGLLASLGPLYWIAHNAYLYSDPLEFYRGIGSTKWIYEQALARGLERAPGDGDFGLAIRYYAEAARLFLGLPLAGLSLAGAAAAAWKRAWWPLFFLLLGPAFVVWSMHGSGATIFVPTLHPHTYYNTRYAVIALPLAALAAAAVPSLLPERFQRLGLIAVVLVAISPWLAYPKQDNWVVWKESDENSAVRRVWTQQAAAYIGPQYVQGRGIVAHFGDQTEIFRQVGIPIRQTVHDGDGLYFQAIVRRPEVFLWQEWVVSLPGDALSRTMHSYAARVPRYRRVKIVEVKGAPRVEIWRRSAGRD